MKKVNVILLVGLISLSIIVGIMSGCSNSTASYKELPTITWYMPKSIDNISSLDVVMAEANKIFNKEIGVNLELILIDGGTYGEKLNMMTVAGDKFDICWMSDTVKFQQYVKSGAFLPLDDLLNNNGQDILAKEDKLKANYSRFNGKRYGVDSHGPLTVANSWVFKKDLIDKYKFDYKNVKCLEDLEPYFKLLKENEPGIIPMFHKVTDYVDESITTAAVDSVVFDEDSEKFLLRYEEPKTLKSLRLKSKFYKNGYIAKDAISKTDFMLERKSGKYAVMNNNGYYTEDGSKSTAVFGFPCVETYAGNTVIITKNSVRNCISATSQNPEKCMQLLNLIWKDEYLHNTLAYGVEGVNYTNNEERSKQIGSKSINVVSGASQTWAIWHNYLGPLWTQWDSSWNSAEALKNIQENNSKAKISKALGFVFDSEPVKNDVAKIAATSATVYTVYEIGCMDDFDVFLKSTINEFRNSGVYTVIDEMNRQYGEWKAGQNRSEDKND